MSSGSETRKRQQRLPVRCTADEVSALRAAAEAAGFASIGDLVRARCLRNTRSPKLPPVDRQQLARTLGQLGKYGSNLNQLAHIANINHNPIAESELYRIAAEVREISAAVLRALRRGHQG